MSTEPTSRKARSLTQEAFASLLFWFSADNEQAAEKYLEVRRKLVSLFVRKGCAHAEELADRTLDRAAVIVQNEPSKYPNAMALCCGVARRVWFEYCREHCPGALQSEVVAPPVEPHVDIIDKEEKCLDICLDELSLRDRALITQYHQYQGAQKIEVRKRLANEYGGLNKVRIMAYRIRIKLHDCVNCCVQRSVHHE
jgi:hypothetical protein